MPVDTETYGKHYLQVGPHRIAYYDEGPRSEQAVLLLHGLFTSAYLWRKVMAHMVGRWRCVAPDLLGLGDTTSQNGTEDYGLSGQAKVLARFCDALELRHVVVVGHALGGAVAQFLAVRHGRHVEGLALCNSAAYDNWPTGFVRLARSVAKRGERAFDLLLRVAARRIAFSSRGFRAHVKHPGAIGPREIEEYIRPFLLSRSARRNLRHLLLRLSNSETWEVANEFYRFQKPVLVVWALDDPHLPLLWGERLATDFPMSTLRTIPDCGHLVPEERPKLLARYLEDFVRDVFDDE